jgi:formate--tetrahydrofolate ligase
MLSDIQIAQNAIPEHIKIIAKKINVDAEDLEYYGKFKAKLPLNLIDEAQVEKSKLILVTAMSPTKYGEGKTTMSIALTDALNHIDVPAMAVLREPSLGPVFGVKGGAAGGGYAQVIPMEDINLHFTGDFSAVEKANNLLSAIIDNNLQNQKYTLNIDPKTISWKRVMDMNDRSLRSIIVGVGTKANGVLREDGFNITPASEIMAILCLAKDMSDLKQRMENIYIGQTYDNQPVFARDLKSVGAMAVLMKDALKPNLVQTLEGNPCILHGGPFASIAQGTNSVIATKMGLSLRGVVVTEAGFGADLGTEKFLHIKCVAHGLTPALVVVVATVRALKHHGGIKANDLNDENLAAVEAGFCNLQRHLENVQKFGLKPIVCINSFPTDTENEFNLVKKLCAEMAIEAEVSFGFAKGGRGGEALAKRVRVLLESPASLFRPLSDAKHSIVEKIQIIAKEIYRASHVEFAVKAQTQLKLIEQLGFNHLPICIAKNPSSFSDDEKLLGAPTDFVLTVREFEISSGAGFIVALVGNIMRMPGLPSIPNAENIDFDEDGKIVGLF